MRVAQTILTGDTGPYVVPRISFNPCQGVARAGHPDDAIISRDQRFLSKFRWQEDCVREITRRVLYFASVVISSSVMPSAKYSSSAPPERFSRGRTAMERIVGCADTERVKCESVNLKAGHTSRSAAAAATIQMVPRSVGLFRCASFSVRGAEAEALDKCWTGGSCFGGKGSNCLAGSGTVTIPAWLAEASGMWLTLAMKR